MSPHGDSPLVLGEDTRTSPLDESRREAKRDHHENETGYKEGVPVEN